MISAVVFMNIKGDVLIYRLYKHDVRFFILEIIFYKRVIVVGR